jgi:cyclohexanecarboxyl-CoA dehydrogenase
MNFGFSQEEEIFRATVRHFADRELRPYYSRWDQGEPFPRDKIKAIAQLGLLGLRAPIEYGGMDASYVQCGIATEEVGRADFNCTLFIQNACIAAELLKLASEDLKNYWFPGLINGEIIAAFALTEPDAGSDAAHIRTRAVCDGECYIINGEKSSVTFAGMADICFVLVRTGGEGARGISTLLVPMNLPGISCALYRSPGQRLSQRGSVYFDGVRVPVANRVGEEGKGFYQAMQVFDFNRALIALAALGAAQQSLEETITYVKERRAFGQPIARFEGVSFQIAEHLTRVEAARLLAYKALWLRDQGLPHTKEMAMTKWFGVRVALDAVRACIGLYGHYGYNQDLPLEQRFRDILGMEIGDGTPEIMKLIIVRETMGREALPY